MSKKHIPERSGTIWNDTLGIVRDAHACAHAHEATDPLCLGTCSTSFQTLTVTLVLHVLPSKGSEPEQAIRLRQWLKLGLRAFNIRAEWAPSPSPTSDLPPFTTNADTPTPAKRRKGKTT